MTKAKQGSCTTILVGKNATIDGSTLIARNEDDSKPLNAQRFVVVQPENQPRHYQAKLSQVALDLPDKPMRYTATPDVQEKFGIWAAAGINSANVAMTATETITNNVRILGIDPLVDNGLGEEDFTTLVLPYIHSAREGVTRLGILIEKYGTYEMNGVAFSDKDEVWYFETIGGHHWAAIRIPDDAYVIAPNRFNIDHFDFDSKDTLFAADLPELIENHHLNPDPQGVNLRHIFGSATIKDTRYNNPRAWYGQKFFNPEFDTSPIDPDLPFICRATKKISVEDVKFVLSSHYENTPYDPYGNGTDAQRKQFRPIGFNRNLELHILQIRPNVPAEVAGIHWLAFGPNTFNAVVPFYANVEDTPAAYRDTTTEMDPTKVYWLTNILALLGDANFHLYEDPESHFEENTVAACRNIQMKADLAFKDHPNVSAYLADVNQQMAELYVKNANHLLGEMLALGEPQMRLNFTLGD